MRLSEARGEDAIDLLAGLIDPVTEIATDKEIERLSKDGTTKIAHLVKVALQNHKKAIVEILAALDGVSAEEYNDNAMTMMRKLLQLMQDPDVMSFFGFSLPTMAEKSSGSVTANTEASVK